MKKISKDKILEEIKANIYKSAQEEIPKKKQYRITKYVTPKVYPGLDRKVIEMEVEED